MQTPLEHGQVLLEPGLGQMGEAIASNRMLSQRWDGFIGTAAWQRRRREARKLLIDAAWHFSRQYDESSNAAARMTADGPILGTGHQCEFQHCGILSKYLVLDALRSKCGATAVNFFVDNDLPKHTELRLPVIKEGRLEVVQVPFLHEDALVPMEYQTLDRLQCEESLKKVEGLAVPGELSAGRQRLVELLRRCLEGSASAVDFFVRMHRRLAGELGLIWLDLPVSLLAQTDCFLEFAGDILLDPRRCVTVYNMALGQYRLKHKVRNALQPLPDLKEQGDWMELPFWVFQKGQRRETLFVKQKGATVVLGADSQTFLEIDKKRFEDGAFAEALHHTGRGLRPKAVTLTTFVRLFLCDYFIHGIGGARYDEVTDAFIAGFYDIDPPAFGCVSATMRLGLGEFEDEAAIKRQLMEVDRLMRQSRFNPQRGEDSERLEQLLRQRRQAIEASESLKANGGSSEQRRRVFEAIRDINTAIQQYQKKDSAQFEAQKRRLLGKLESSRIACDREYFSGLFSLEQIQLLKEALSDRHS